MKLCAVTSSSRASGGFCSGWVNTCFGPLDSGDCEESLAPFCDESEEPLWDEPPEDEPPEDEPPEPLCGHASGAANSASTIRKGPNWIFIATSSFSLRDNQCVAGLQL